MVEWKSLGEICEVFAGGDLPNNYIKESKPFSEFKYPIFSNGIEDKSLYGFSDSFRVDKPAITISARGTIGYHTIRKSKFTPIVRLITLIPKNQQLVNLSYLNEALYKTNIDGTKGGIPQLTVPVVSKIKVPIPLLSEQNRIVGILDTFTSSIENLKEQIAQRRKQYEYYRDQLLDLEGKEGVEMKTCGEFCEVTDYVANGSFATLRENVIYKQEPDYAVLVRTVDLSRGFEGDKIFIDEKAYKFLSKSSLFGGEIIINNIGAGVGQTFRCPYLKERMSLAPNSIMVKTPNNDYFFYWFNSIYGQNAMMKIVTPGAMPKFNKTGFKTILVPIPSLQEQNRIVSILDTFEASIQNLEDQLSQREKQYEYYRNKLLTFE